MKSEEKRKEKLKEWLCVILTSFFVPCILTLLISGTSETAGRKESGLTIEMEDGQTMDGEEFLLYMVAGQIDFNVEKETLKVQSVIARTNLLRELNGAKSGKANELNVTYLTPSKLENNLGKMKRDELIKKLNQAIGDTYPYVMTYEGALIEALYHPVSIGTTVSGEEIFGKGRAYLIEVDSSQDVEAEQYMSMSEWSGKDLLAKLQGIGIGKELTTDTVFTSLKIEEKTKNGYVKQVAIGTERLSGEEWKTLFGLNSAYFYLEEAEGQLRMVVLGKGHSVGLSQYGANKMAIDGIGWKNILSKYYPGAVLEK